jgi:hypothetical protein
MSNIQATLHLMCGKICAGKSTLAMRLATTPNTIIVSEDHWLSRLYPDEIVALPDYIRCASRLRAAMGPHVESLLVPMWLNSRRFGKKMFEISRDLLGVAG